MSVKKILLVLIISFFSFFSCKKYDALGKEIKFHELYKAHWLLGDWEKKDSLGILTESWTTLDDSTYIGTSYYILNSNDTVHFEKIQLMEDKNMLIYTATVRGENNNKPISFRMIEDKDSLLVFENKKHDYPQKIRYELEIDNSILATVSGTQNKKESSQSYLLQSKREE